jgi:hypothetical protein
MNAARLLLSVTILAALPGAASARLAPERGARELTPRPATAAPQPAPAITTAERNYFVAPQYDRCRVARTRGIPAPRICDE